MYLSPESRVTGLIARRSLIISVALLVTALSFLMMWGSQTAHGSEKDEVELISEAGTPKAYPESIGDKREKAFIGFLKEESLEESLSKLNVSSAYQWPGSSMYSQGFRINKYGDPALQRGHSIQLLSSRRFRKVLFELNELPKEVASQLVRDELTLALKEYKIQSNEFMSADDSVKMSMLGLGLFDFENGQDLRSGFPGSHLKILALTLLAGHLELESCQDVVYEVARLAMNNWQEEFPDDQVFDDSEIGTRYFGLEYNRLYNPPVLVMGILGVTGKGMSRLETTCDVSQFSLLPFDNPTVSFQQHLMPGAVKKDPPAKVYEFSLYVFNDSEAGHMYLRDLLEAEAATK